MTRKKISLVQVNFQQGPKHFNAHYLPYSVGILWSYVNQFESISKKYTLDHVICIREHIDVVFQKLKDQNVVAFSCYVWNKNYNIALAKKIKDYNPECLIIFGGPEPNHSDANIFKSLSCVDIIVKNEGELVFKEILDGTKPLKDIPGIVYNDQGKSVDTGLPVRIENLCELPSPYLTGFFDRLIEQFPDIEWNATLETNRGCPYACTFCDWGSLTYNKIKKFDLDRVFAEMEWIAKHKCGFLSVTDANFGIFVDRDNLIIDRFIELQNSYGYPYTFNVSWAKNQNKEVLNIVKKLISNDALNHGLTLSFQTFDNQVLDIIKRKNMHNENIEEIFSLAEQQGIPVTSELILGLPGETLQSWKENFWTLFRSGNHSGIDIFQTQLLENAELNRLQKSLHKIKAVTVYDYMSGSHNNNDLAEGVDIIIETATMPFEDMVKSQIFSLFINTFHINGLSNFLSRFLYRYQGIDYSEFYHDLYGYIKLDPYFDNELQSFESYTRQWMKDGKIDHPVISGVEIHGWNLVYRSIINFHTQNKKNHVIKLLEHFLDRYYLDPLVKKELMKLQSNYVIDFDCLAEYPKKVIFDCNVYDYIVAQNDLQKAQNMLIFGFNDKKTMLHQEFLEKIYFGRRRNFGKACISSCEMLQ